MTVTASAMLGTCDDCGTPGPVLNVNSISNPYMLCGRCQYAHLGDIDSGGEWNSRDGNQGLTILNTQVWIMATGLNLIAVSAAELPELIIALQVAQARHKAASRAQEQSAVNRAEDGNGVEGWVEAK